MAVAYISEQIKKIEDFLVTSGLVTEYQLMQRAGHAVWTAIQQQYSELSKLLIFCGSGNNAGDGYVISLLAHHAGCPVEVFSILDPHKLSGSAQKAYQAAREAGVSIELFSAYESYQEENAVFVDALLGTGFHGLLEADWLKAVQVINAAEVPTVSVDVPSGLNANTGSVNPCAVQADMTVTMLAAKTGLYTNQGRSYAGQILVDHLGVDQDSILSAAVDSQADLVSWEQAQLLLPEPRARHVHKGDCGHVLVIGGDYGMGGAVRLAAEGALRVGAGLVTVATRPEHLNVVSGARPEIMCHEVSSEKELDPLLQKAQVVVIGPGLGRTEWAKMLLDHVLAYEGMKVLDADALNLLAAMPAHTDQSWVLTPHPGEAGRLLGCSTNDIQDDRFRAIQAMGERYGGVVILKGAGTLVSAAHSRMNWLCCDGNPGMASAGMGDVLSGIVGGLMAQGLDLDRAATLGVCLHAHAGDIAAMEKGERGLLASDVLSHIRLLVNNKAQPINED